MSFSFLFSRSTVGAEWQWRITWYTDFVYLVVSTENSSPNLTQEKDINKKKNVMIPFNHIAFVVAFLPIANLLQTWLENQELSCSFYHLFISAVSIDVWKSLLAVFATSEKISKSWSIAGDVCVETHFFVQPSRANNSLFYRFSIVWNNLWNLQQHSNTPGMCGVKEKLFNQLKIYWIVPLILSFQKLWIMFAGVRVTFTLFAS